MSRLKKLALLLALVGTLLTAGVGSGAATNAVPYNVEPGGGSTVSFIYISRVYTYYNGYWHWLNCEWIVYTDGSAIQNRCW